MIKKTLLLVVVSCLLCLSLSCEDADDRVQDGNSGGGMGGGGGGDSDSDTDSDGDGDTDNGGDSDADSDTDSDTDADGDHCAEQDFNIEPAPVMLMLLEDMSSSMSGMLNPGGGGWPTARGALRTLLTNWDGKGIQFGFDIFPHAIGGTCDGMGRVVMDCALGQEQQIINKINSISPSGGTPFFLAMEKFLDPTYSPNCTDVTKGSAYLAVIADGGNGCDQADGSEVTPGAFGQLARDLLAKGIKTFAIGFGNSFNQQELTQIIRNGGTGRTEFLKAGNDAALQAALEDIASSVVSCVYDLKDVGKGAVQDDVNFYFDDKVVGYDENCDQKEGWSWANDQKTKVEFCEQACSKMQMGEVDTISATFGCPTQSVVY